MTTGHAPEPGLRELRKQRTRARLRAAAMRLFSEQGYDRTTVDQIARAAEVSHTTFFRYFQTKEQMVISDDLDEVIVRELAAIPPGLDRFALIRQIIVRMYDLAAADPWAADPQRLRLLIEEPALRDAHQSAKEEAIAEATEFVADYLAVPVADPGLQVFIAAVGGIVFRFADDDPAGLTDGTVRDRVLAAIDLLEAGLPVGQSAD